MGFPKQNTRIIIVIPKGPEDIRFLEAHKELIEDAKMLCVIDNDDSHLKKIVHRLRPRYISYSFRDFSDVSHVVLNIVTALEIKRVAMEKAIGLEIGNGMTTGEEESFRRNG